MEIKLNVHVNTPTKLEGIVLKNDNNAVACNRALWANWIIYLWYKWTNECVCIWIWIENHKWKMSFVVEVVFSLYVVPMLLVPKWTELFNYGKPNEQRDGEKERETERKARSKVTILFMRCAILSWHCVATCRERSLTADIAEGG